MYMYVCVYIYIYIYIYIYVYMYIEQIKQVEADSALAEKYIRIYCYLTRIASILLCAASDCRGRCGASVYLVSGCPEGQPAGGVAMEDPPAGGVAMEPSSPGLELRLQPPASPLHPQHLQPTHSHLAGAGQYVAMVTGQ